MCRKRRLPRGRDAFTLIELLVVMALILLIFALGVGYVVFGQSNQHSVVGANAVTGAMLNAKQRGHHDGVPTGVRLLFGTNNLPATECGQIELIQQPEDYSAGQITAVGPAPAPPPASQQQWVTFNGVDMIGGADYAGQIDQSTVQAGDYFTFPPLLVPHRINTVQQAAANGPATLNLDSPVGLLSPGQPYFIIRQPRRLVSEDVIQLPPSVVIDNSQVQNSAAGVTYCRNLPSRTLTDSKPTTQNVAEIVFGPSGAVVGQGTGADKILLWLRDPSQKQPYLGVPLIASIQVRTGLISVYQVAPWNPAQPIVIGGNDPYRYAEDGRASGM